MLESDHMENFLDNFLSPKVIGPVITAIVMYVFYRILKRIIRKIFNFKTKKIKYNKQITLMNFFINAARIVCFIIAIVVILGIYGVETGAIITSLGAVTVVLGLAFQDLLKDFIAGISFILEDSYNVGDWVTINGFKGEVVSLGMRATRIKAYEGQILIINNGSITEVINHNAADSLAIVDIRIPYEEDNEKIEAVLNSLCLKMQDNLPNLKGEVSLLGIEKLDNNALVYRITALVESGEQFAVQRDMRKQIKLELDKNNIKIPYEKLVIQNERV